MKRKSIVFFVSILVLMLVFMVSSNVLAVGEAVSIDALDTNACSSGMSAGGTVTHVNGTEATDIRFTLTNNTKGTSESFTSIILPSGTYSFSIGVPTFTEEGDLMTMRIELLAVDASVLVSDSLTYPCGPQQVEEVTEPVPGCDVLIPLTDTAVVGTFVDNTAAYWMPGETTNIVIEVGKTAWVLGMDESGAYYKIVWSCELLWVPVGSMGPNYDDVWNGTPLPTDVVE